MSVDPCTYSSFVISRRGTTRPSFFPSTSGPPGAGDQVYSSCPELCGHTHKTSFFSTYCRTDRTCNYYYSRTDEPKVIPINTPFQYMDNLVTRTDFLPAVQSIVSMNALLLRKDAWGLPLHSLDYSLVNQNSLLSSPR